MSINSIPSFSADKLNVIIETPRNSNCKFLYDSVHDVFYVKKPMPPGMVFPFDFGFVPGTLAEDGDPLDVMVIMEHMVYPGCLVHCRPVAVLQAEQKEKGKQKKVRNDRVIAIAASSVLYAGINDIKELNPKLPAEIESFFTDYNNRQGNFFFCTWLARTARSYERYQES